MPEIEFKGKQRIYAHHKTIPHHPLIRDDGKSLNSLGEEDNLIIHGDNLLALKALMPKYAGRIHCIYIDPPYNTGNEGWAYNDNVNSLLMNEWLSKAVDREDLEKHDKWLCMMWPRLQLLKELLSEDGAIFVSIDDNEQHHLRMLMDEIFGAENFISSIIWNKMDSPKNTTRRVSGDHETIHLYAKDSQKWRPNLLPRTEKMLKRYTNPDNDPRGPWLLSDLAARNPYDKGRYSITTPSGKVIEGPPAGSSWRVSKDKFEDLDKDNRIWWGETGDNRPGIKRFLSEVKKGTVPRTLWEWKEVGSTRHSKQELSSIMSAPASSDLFVTPKPSRLIRKILQIATEEDSMVLDSFAGSGTTAHAVLAANQEDGGTRKFILVECEDYADSLTAQRVRRVISGVPESNDQGLKEGLGGSFTYCTLGDPIETESLLRGTNLPKFQALANYLLYTESSVPPKHSELKAKNGDGLFYETEEKDYYLLYKPDREWLRSNEAMLSAERVRRIAERNNRTGKKAVVFAPGKYMGQRTLTASRITFSQLPYEIHQGG